MRIIDDFGGHLAYYVWEGDPAIHVLELLQEGLGRRLEEVPSALTAAVERLLAPRWDAGDAYDRTMVIRLGGILPQKRLQECLSYAINAPSRSIGTLAFQQIVFLTDMPVTLAEWVRERLSRAVFGARRRVELLRLEALSARLPAGIGSRFVLRRCRLLRRLLFPLKFVSPFSFLEAVSARVLRERPSVALSTDVAIMSLFVMPLSLAAVLIIPTIVGIDASPAVTSRAWWRSRTASMLLTVFACAYIATCISIVTLYINRAVGCRLSSAYFLQRVRALGTASTLARSGTNFPGVLLAVGLVIVAFVGPGAVVQSGRWLAGYGPLRGDGLFLLYFGSWVVAMLLLGIVFGVDDWLKRRAHLARLRRLRNAGLSGPSVVLQAASMNELEVWLDSNGNPLRGDVSAIRSLSRLLLSKLTYQPEDRIFGAPLFQSADLALHRGVLFSLERDLALALGANSLPIS